MKRLLLPALLFTTLTACTAAPADTLPAAAPTPTPTSTPAPTAAPTPADALTPEEKIGQLFIIRPDASPPSPDPYADAPETINDAKADARRRDHAGPTDAHGRRADAGRKKSASFSSFVCGSRRPSTTQSDHADAMRENPVRHQFGKNITDPEQLAQFNADLQAASRTPLFIAVDEEGGAVARLANHPAFDLPQYESAAAVGASGDPADACAMGQTIGAYLKEYGFNMDFAPDADVNTNPDNPIIGTRAFSSDAATAAEMAAAAADGLRTGGILPTLKHFPGHGDTAEDSHTALAVTYKTLDELQACELLPFAADTGLHAVMVGHIAAPNVTGDGTPATLSPQLVALIPDAENTLIVTDSLAMDAITAAYTPGEAAVQALQAGCDVLLMPNSLPEAYAAVLEAVQNGTISEERLDRSVNKILLYKQQFAS